MTASSAQGADVVLAVNAGSSSLKYGLHDRQGQVLWGGQFDGLHGDAALRQALQSLLPMVQARPERLCAVVHRIVHGGSGFMQPCVIDDAALQALAALNALAPLHQPHNLAGVAAFRAAFPALPQIGCFDTAFHASMPEVERCFALPRELSAQGLRRYGFHGLAYASVLEGLQAAGAAWQGRCVLMHLGSGASVCAVQGGRSVATSMGFSAVDGLMMGTRTGSLDPGVLLHLLGQGWDAAALQKLLYRESGLLGVSGLSADMRVLRASSDARAAEAIALFTHRVLREVGAMVALLGGVDLLAFSGGIGEHDALLRAELAAALRFAGVRLDVDANAAASIEAGGHRAAPLHAADSVVQLWVVPADEGAHAARAAFALLDAQAA